MHSAGVKRFAVLLAASATAACGSSNRAPVVYGTQPVQPTARIYNSAAESASAYPARRQAPAYTPSAYSPALSDVVLEPAVASGPLSVTPVAETWREERGGARPVLVAQNTVDPYAPAAELPGQVTVLPGDTVYAIARRTGATPQSIITLNRLEPPYSLNIGDIIRVPANSVPPSRAEAPSAPQPLRDSQHVVRAGETLYSISRATGAPVAAIAASNSIGEPYALRVGQTLRIPAAGAVASAAAPEADVGDLARQVSYGAPPVRQGSIFDWPVQGRMIGSYGLSEAGKQNDGVNIAAPIGTPVRAAADGEVVYRGSELNGYGNLLLIRHEDGFVTAYAHNDAMLVKKGDRVRKGQVIAKVGQTGSASEPQLHFEIRQNLKAVDPVALIGSL